MAIVFSVEGRKVSWLLIIGIIFVFGGLLASTYYLFFSSTPFIETIIPPDVQEASEISKIEIDANSIRQVTDHELTKKLRQYVNPPIPGSFGRGNPFIVEL